MVAVQHHMAGIYLGHGVDQIGRHAQRGRAVRHAVELHADFHEFGQHAAFLEKNERRVVVAESVFRFQMQLRLESDFLTCQFVFYLGQQIVAAIKKLNRFGQFVDQSALGVFKSPDQADDAGRCDFHFEIIAQAPCAQRSNATIGRMDITLATPLLGGLSPQAFMRRHWQKKPLLVRAALNDVKPPLSRSELFALAEHDDVDSRLIVNRQAKWSIKQGPFTRRRLPPLTQAGWTLLVQGVDLHAGAAHQLLSKFRFVPDARLDDLMMSYATDGGGVGPHFDSYDVFLLQVQGKRRWRIGRMTDAALQPNMPLKILSNFQPEEEMTLEAGDMLYLPPRWAHDGVADGECITCSIGFRAPSDHELAREVLQRLLQTELDDDDAKRYRDPKQLATDTPAKVPAALQIFALEAVSKTLGDHRGLASLLGEWLTEPKAQVWFDEDESVKVLNAMQLDSRTRMMYDDHHVFINGESFRASGRDAVLMRRLADARHLDAAATQRLSSDAAALALGWAQAGWLNDARRDAL